MTRKYASSPRNRILWLTATMTLICLVVDAFHFHMILKLLTPVLEFVPTQDLPAKVVGAYFAFGAFVIFLLFGLIGHHGPIWKAVKPLPEGEKGHVLKRIFTVVGTVVVVVLCGAFATVVVVVTRPTRDSVSLIPTITINTPIPVRELSLAELTERYRVAVAEKNFIAADDFWKALQDRRLPSSDLPNEARGDHCVQLFDFDEAVARYRLALKNNRSPRLLGLLAMYLPQCRRSINPSSNSQEAISFGNEAVTLARTVDNAEDITLALHGRGVAYWAAGERTSATADFEAAYAKCPTDDHVTRALICSNLATARDNMGEPDKADIFYKESLALLEKGLIWESADKAIVMANIAASHRKSGKLRESIELHRKAESMMLRACGCIESPETCIDTRVAFIRNNLALALAALGDSGSLAEAEHFARLAYQTYLKKVNSNHVDLAKSESTLAHVLMLQDQCTEEAEKLSRSSLDKFKNLFPDDHFEKAMAGNNLATLLARRHVLIRQSEPDNVRIEIDTLYENALSMLRRLGRDAPARDLALILRNFGTRLAQRGQKNTDLPLVNEGIGYLREAVSALDTLYGDHPSVDRGSFTYGLAMALKRANRFLEAEAVALQSADFYRKALGGDSHFEALCLALAARCRLETVGPDDALKIAQVAYEMAERTGNEQTLKATDEVLNLIKKRQAALAVNFPSGVKE